MLNNLQGWFPVMGARDMITIFATGNIPDFSGREKPADLFFAEEIDALDAGMLSGMNREELAALRRKLSDSYDGLESGDWEEDDPRWAVFERRLEHISEITEMIDEILDPDEDDESVPG